MTSRDRVRKALNFEEPDRIPIDWGEITISGITVTAYQNLLKYLGLEEEITVSDPIQRLALPSETVLQKYNVDTRVIWANAPSFWERMRTGPGKMNGAPIGPDAENTAMQPVTPLQKRNQ